MNTSARGSSLSTKTAKPEYDHQKTLEAFDTYIEGAFAVLGLINEVRWNPQTRTFRSGSRYEIGRRMTTSPANRVSPSVDVTPDCVVQAAEQTGLVAEAKLGLPKDENRWDTDLLQIQKYDDDLSGWWTGSERIQKHDILVLVPITRAVRFIDRLKKGIAAGQWRFDRLLSVVGFFKQSGVKDFITLKKEWGELSDNDFSERLRESRAIAFDTLIVDRDRKFIDSAPPLPYLLQVMWDDLFTVYAAQVEKREGADWIELAIGVSKVTEDLQEYFGSRSAGPRSPEIPKPAWVRKALDVLVVGKMAETKGQGEYVIRYKRTRADTLRKFGRLCFQLEQRRKAKVEKNTPYLPGLERSPAES